MTNPPISLDALRDAIRKRRYQMKYHALQRCLERGYSYRDVEQIILTGEIVERYPKARPFPKCLMMKIVQDEPTYVVVAYNPDNDYAYIVTVHGYDPEKWVDPRTRRT